MERMKNRDTVPVQKIIPNGDNLKENCPLGIYSPIGMSPPNQLEYKVFFWHLSCIEFFIRTH